MNSKVKKIYFRFDAGGLIGFGHLGRVEAISDECKKFEIEPVWVIRKRPSLKNLTLKYSVIWLEESDDVTDINTETWKSVSGTKEANDFFDKVSDAEVVFVDHYSLYDDFVELLRQKNIKTICILDFLPTEFSCDIAINYNVGAERELEIYKQKNSHCCFLLGPKFAPIKQVSFKKPLLDPYETVVKNIGVYIGGVSFELHQKLLKIIESVEFFRHKKIKWCISSDSVLGQMQKESRTLNIEFLGRQDTLLDFYKWTDVVVGASGVSFLERSYIGIPQVLFKVADNQNDVVRYLTEEKLSYYAGDLANESVDSLSRALSKIKEDEVYTYASNAFQIYDGKGQCRLLENILEILNVVD